ncbi:MAG TPA: M20/M25/M40 family metallo-hydrolase [Terriglobales bacterium]|nr:M20/M25/M40 family metallo-hydrolase [Terriglobales bacterium]
MLLPFAIYAAIPLGLGAQERDFPLPKLPADPKITAALKEISPHQIHATIEKLASFGTRLTLSAQDPSSIASGHGIGAAREWIKSEFERYSRDCGGCLEVRTDTFTQAPADRIPKSTEITNVYAVLKGTDSENAKRVVLVTGHYDSRNSDTLDTTGAAPGANDDASGTAVSLECARVLSKLKFPATIIFLTVAGEEQGLNGSHHFAWMSDQKRDEWQIEAVLNNDIVGGDKSPQQDPRTVRVFSEGIPSAMVDPYRPPASTVLEDEIVRRNARTLRSLGGENDSPSRQLARYITEVARTYSSDVSPQLVFRPDRYLRGGDHSSFNEYGFAAVRFTEYREDYHHQHQNVRTENGIEYGDLPKFVNFDYVADVARLNAATLAALASAPGPPTSVHLLTKELENDSTFTWDKSPRASGYEVLWRATASPDWEHARDVGNVTRATLPISKDNVIFAVRAIDAEGHRSLPVVPTPER